MSGYWTLPQSLSWLITGSSDVNKHASAFDVINNALRAGNARLALAARDEMQERLQQGVLVACGVRSNGEAHTDIPRADWLTLTTLLLHHGTVPPTAVSIDGEVRYRDVRLKVEDVRAMRSAVLSKATTPHAEAKKAIASAIALKGEALTMRELEDLRRKECEGFPRDLFREIAIEVQGPQKKGRPKGTKNARK
jgi:hypothetical protein